MHGSPQTSCKRAAALTDQLAIVRWQLDQVRQQIRAMQRNLRNTETTAETRARVLREMAAAGATINIQHNQGDGVTYAGFLNTSAATVTIANGASVTYVGNGTNFVQMS